MVVLLSTSKAMPDHQKPMAMPSTAPPLLALSLPRTPSESSMDRGSLGSTWGSALSSKTATSRPGSARADDRAGHPTGGGRLRWRVCQWRWSGEEVVLDGVAARIFKGCWRTPCNASGNLLQWGRAVEHSVLGAGPAGQNTEL